MTMIICTNIYQQLRTIIYILNIEKALDARQSCTVFMIPTKNQVFASLYCYMFENSTVFFA